MTPRLLQRPHARPASRRGTTMLHPECPIEQAVYSDDAHVQGELAREIWCRHSFLDEGTMLVARFAASRCARGSMRKLREIKVPAARGA